ncbi:hypothetical protein ACFE04_024995 [Oxalis oulophora]
MPAIKWKGQKSSQMLAKFLSYIDSIDLKCVCAKAKGDASSAHQLVVQRDQARAEVLAKIEAMKAESDFVKVENKTLKGECQIAKGYGSLSACTAHIPRSSRHLLHPSVSWEQLRKARPT